MGAIHYHPMKIALAELLRGGAAVHVRRAEPPVRVEQSPERVQWDRLLVVECVHPPGLVPAGAILEVRHPRGFAQQALERNPYSHPVQLVYQVDPPPGGSFPCAEPEFIVFLSQTDFTVDASRPGSLEYACGGVWVPVSRKDELRALAPPPAPPKTIEPAWLTRLKQLFGRKR